MHALIIEDDFLIAVCIEDILRDAGFTSVAIAASEDEAVQMVAERRPDFVTSDVNLTEGTGTGAVATILAAHPVPVVFVTSVPAEARRHHPTIPVVAKPFCPAMLHRVIAERCPNSTHSVRALEAEGGYAHPHLSASHPSPAKTLSAHQPPSVRSR